MNLDALAGNAALKRQLSAQEAGRGLSHAYLISGPAGSGKRTLARLMAAAMVCSGQGEKPCLACPGCRKVMGGIHPDVTTVSGGGKDIAVSQVRALRRDAYVRPNEAPRKVYVIDGAQDLNAPAQNALLKLLEEGPAYAAFLLLTDNPGAVLPTVRSRCEALSLAPVSREEAEAALVRKYPGRSREELACAAAACGGSIGRAAEKLEGAGDGETAGAALELLELLAERDELALAAWCVGREKWPREKLGKLLELETGLLRDALVLQVSPGGGEARPAVRQAAERLSRRALLGCAELTEKLRRDLEFNVGGGHLCGALAAGLSQVLSR